MWLEDHSCTTRGAGNGALPHAILGVSWHLRTEFPESGRFDALFPYDIQQSSVCMWTFKTGNEEPLHRTSHHKMAVPGDQQHERQAHKCSVRTAPVVPEHEPTSSRIVPMEEKKSCDTGARSDSWTVDDSTSWPGIDISADWDQAMYADFDEVTAEFFCRCTCSSPELTRLAAAEPTVRLCL